MARIYLLVLIGIVLASQVFAHQDREPNPNDERIVGGLEVDIVDYPHQAALVSYYEGESTLSCGASVIGPTWLLTAKHCLVINLDILIEVSFYRIRVGSSDYNKNGFLHELSTVMIYPRSDNSSFHLTKDFGLVQLRSPVQYNDRVQPIALPLPDQKIADGATVVVLGWGSVLPWTEEFDRISSKQSGLRDTHLRGTSLIVVNHDECKATYIEVNMQNDMFCASAVGKSTCQGDSGGPVILNGTLVGIVSFARGCARPRSPGVYANVAFARKWITENTGILNANR